MFTGREFERAQEWQAATRQDLKGSQQSELLCIPDLVALNLPGLVAAAGYPGTRVIPALSSILSLERVQLRDLHSTWDDLRSWGSGTATCLYGPDIEAVTFFPPGLKVFEPGATSVMYQFLMRYDLEAGLRVLNLWDYFPEPGWPPRLWAESPA